MSLVEKTIECLENDTILNPSSFRCLKKKTKGKKSKADEVLKSGEDLIKNEIDQLHKLFLNIDDNLDLVYSVWANKKLTFDMKCALLKNIVEKKSQSITISLKKETKAARNDLKHVFDDSKLKKMNTELKDKLKNQLVRLQSLQQSLQSADNTIKDLTSRLQNMSDKNGMLSQQLDAEKKQVIQLQLEKKHILSEIARIAGKDNNSDFKKNVDAIVQRLNDCKNNQKIIQSIPSPSSFQPSGVPPTPIGLKPPPPIQIKDRKKKRPKNCEQLRNYLEGKELSLEELQLIRGQLRDKQIKDIVNLYKQCDQKVTKNQIQTMQQNIERAIKNMTAKPARGMLYKGVLDLIQQYKLLPFVIKVINDTQYIGEIKNMTNIKMGHRARIYRYIENQINLRNASIEKVDKIIEDVRKSNEFKNQDTDLTIKLLTEKLVDTPLFFYKETNLEDLLSDIGYWNYYDDPGNFEEYDKYERTDPFEHPQEPDYVIDAGLDQSDVEHIFSHSLKILIDFNIKDDGNGSLIKYPLWVIADILSWENPFTTMSFIENNFMYCNIEVLEFFLSEDFVSYFNSDELLNYLRFISRIEYEDDANSYFKDEKVGYKNIEYKDLDMGKIFRIISFELIKRGLFKKIENVMTEIEKLGEKPKYKETKGLFSSLLDKIRTEINTRKDFNSASFKFADIPTQVHELKRIMT